MLVRGAGLTTAPGRNVRIGRKITLGVAVVALLTTAVVAGAAGSSAPSTGEGHLAGARRQAEFFGASNSVLDYHGGPVMHTNSTFMIYWSPPGAPGRAVDERRQRLANVAADSGTGDNLHTPLLQYYDTAAIGYRPTFAGTT
jgi:hypothetical protein